MVSTKISVFDFMQKQKEKFHIPAAAPATKKEFINLAQYYSDFEGTSGVQPNYYAALYYAACYALQDNDWQEGQMFLFSTTGLNEEAMFKSAYEAFCEGKDLTLASKLLRPLADHGHLEALRMYWSCLLDLGIKSKDWDFKPYERLKQLGDPIQNKNLPGIIAMCFEQNPQALYQFSRYVNPEMTYDNWTGLQKSTALTKVLYDWLVVLYSRRISLNKKDGYAMYQMAEEIYGSSLSPLENADYAQYWKLQSADSGYGPANSAVAWDIINAENFGKFGSGGVIYSMSIANLDQALVYADRAAECGVANGEGAVQVIAKLKQEESDHIYALNQAAMRNQANQIEAQMKEYRAKLDRQERFLNYLADGTPWTNKTDEAYGWVTKDYDRVVENAALQMMRENKEQRHLEKLQSEAMNYSVPAQGGLAFGVNPEKGSVMGRGAKPKAGVSPMGMQTVGEEPRHLNRLYDEIINYFNMTLPDSITPLPSNEQKASLLRAAARQKFHSLIDTYISSERREGCISYAKGGFLGINRKRYGNDLKIRENGTVAAETFYYGKNKKAAISLFEGTSAEKDLRAMTNIIQIACCRWGVVGLGEDGGLSYAGTEETFKRYVSGIQNAKEILPNHDQTGVYALIEDGNVVEITDRGTHKVDSNVRHIINKEGLDFHTELMPVYTNGKFALKNRSVEQICYAYAFEGYPSDVVIGIEEDGTLYYSGIKEMPEELWLMNGIVSAEVQRWGDSITVTRFNGDKKKFTVKFE